MGLFTVQEEKIRYTDVSRLSGTYTDDMNREYDWMSRVYGLFMFLVPGWKRWLRSVIPHIRGE